MELVLGFYFYTLVAYIPISWMGGGWPINSNCSFILITCDCKVTLEGIMFFASKKCD
jgi:hypothetical protein